LERFQDWCEPEIKHGVPTKYGWIVSYPEGLILGWGTDIGAFCYLQAEAGIEIGRYVQLGGGCKIYSVSTIDNKRGTVILGENCKIGSNSVIMPNDNRGELGGRSTKFCEIRHDNPKQRDMGWRTCEEDRGCCECRFRTLDRHTPIIAK
jgi:NDP-sugar pyrophosphorylase family protein